MTFINLLPLMLSRGACVPAAVDVRDHVSFQTLHPILDAPWHHVPRVRGGPLGNAATPAAQGACMAIRDSALPVALPPRTGTTRRPSDVMKVPVRCAPRA
jgi:hypothetical protein